MKIKKISFIAISLLMLQCVACQPAPDAGNTPTEVPAKNTPGADQNEQPDGEGFTEEASGVPVFSKNGGFYKTAFNLTLSSDEGIVYYTTDGSDPRNSETAQKYTEEIKIYDNTKEPNVYSAVKDITLNGYNPPDFYVDKGINIRAVVRFSDGTYGPVVTNSYFVYKKAAYYTDFKVISMVTDADYLFHPDTGAYMVGSGYYDWIASL